MLFRGTIVALGLAAGVGLFAYLIIRQGWESIAAEIIRFGFVPFLGFVAISLVIFTLYSWRWQIIINRHLDRARRLSLWQVYLHRMSGYAVSYLTPVAQVGGEPARIALLVTDKVTTKEAVSSVTLDIAFELCAYIFFIIAGVIFAIVEGAGNGAALGYASVGLLGLFAVLLGFLVAIASGKRLIARLVKRFRIERRPTGRWLIDVEGLMTDFFKGRARLVAGIVVLSLVMISMRIVEVYYLATVFGVDLTFGQLFLVSTLPGIALLLPVPAGLGVFEGGFAALFSMMGIPLDPVAFAMIIRLRDLLFIGVGVVHMARQGGAYFAERMAEASKAMKQT